eukprot:TRINITY_DN27289_c0_g1_i1.p1 TRINITY_DN27289_c0_g1~~TRINITY_DN27289_c0_g1_i1.p1  ORF type:complete len:387 (+),score=85.60 TRINITY_DN27289_c0_g1_i1:68-1228(+)
MLVQVLTAALGSLGCAPGALYDTGNCYKCMDGFTLQSEGVHGGACVPDTLGAVCPSGVEVVGCAGKGELNAGEITLPADKAGVWCWRVDCSASVTIDYGGDFELGCRDGLITGDCGDGDCNTLETFMWLYQTQPPETHVHRVTGCGGGNGIAASPPKSNRMVHDGHKGAVLRLDTTVSPNRGAARTIAWTCASPVWCAGATPGPAGGEAGAGGEDSRMVLIAFLLGLLFFAVCAGVIWHYKCTSSKRKGLGKGVIDGSQKQKQARDSLHDTYASYEEIHSPDPMLMRQTSFNHSQQAFTNQSMNLSTYSPVASPAAAPLPPVAAVLPPASQASRGSRRNSGRLIPHAPPLGSPSHKHVRRSIAPMRSLSLSTSRYGASTAGPPPPV